VAPLKDYGCTICEQGFDEGQGVVTAINKVDVYICDRCRQALEALFELLRPMQKCPVCDSPTGKFEKIVMEGTRVKREE
jgi:rubrerythrin